MGIKIQNIKKEIENMQLLLDKITEELQELNAKMKELIL